MTQAIERYSKAQLGYNPWRVIAKSITEHLGLLVWLISCAGAAQPDGANQCNNIVLRLHRAYADSGVDGLPTLTRGHRALSAIPPA